MRTGPAFLLSTCLLSGCPAAAPSTPTWELTDPSTSVVVPDDTLGTTGRGDGGTGSTGGPAEDSSAAASSGTTGAPFPDLPPQPDLGDLAPEGCKGKIDFLFVVSSMSVMQSIQTRMIDAFADFHATIAANFADFDYHIMVVDGDLDWGNAYCNEDCAACKVPGYPCQLVDGLDACDLSYGGGHVANAGTYASNRDCGVVGGRRFLTREQPKLGETFSCIAQVGTDGYEMLGKALTESLSPEFEGPGGCNQGFLRDDALLMVTFVMGGNDYDSPGGPEEWAQAVVDAKGGDPGAVVMFGLFAPDCTADPEDRLCQMVTMFPYWQVESNQVDDYGPAFAKATELVDTACTAFIPK